MKTYIGTKLLKAKPMTRGEYNQYREWELPANENSDDNGYLVEYLDSPNSNHPDHDNYISWSPVDVFENAYQEVNGLLSFGQALEILKAGGMVARKGWNGKDMFVFQRPADTLSAQMVVEKVKSLPDSVKEYYKNKYKGDYNKAGGGEFTIDFTGYLCMKAADDSIVNGWLASQTDMLAKDWFYVK